jgi:translation elongation factor EF-4
MHRHLSGAIEGVQAQTMSVYHTAQAKGLKIIPILNKVSEL